MFGKSETSGDEGCGIIIVKIKYTPDITLIENWYLVISQKPVL